MKTERYFGYGALNSRQLMKEIIGRDPGEGTSGIVSGYQLTYQVLDQIPGQVREVLKSIWGSDFRAYTLRAGNGFVSGTVWELTEEEMVKVRNWNFIGTWRELVTSDVTVHDGSSVRVLVDKVPESQPVKETVDGIRYEVNINHAFNRQRESEFDTDEMELIRRQLRGMADGRFGFV